MKKVLALLLALCMVFALCACGGNSNTPAEPSAPAQETPAAENEGAEAPDEAPSAGIAASDITIGVVCVGDRSDMGYNYNHIIGIEAMQEALGIADEQIIYKTNILEDSGCDTAVRELVEAGCDIIFANSFGHETYMVEVAEEYPDIQFCHATGYMGATDDLANTHNYFSAIHEARYLAGIAAGLKAKEINNPKLGYVGALPFAEVISGYTAFYLGAKSVYPEVTMDVTYTGTWSDATLEAQAAQALIDRGCGVISQHSDTTAPATTAEANGVFQVGYNADMISAAPKASLVSARVNWGAYYTLAIECMLNGTEVPQDWSSGLVDGAVYLSPLNEDIIAEGTAEAIETAKAALIAGDIHVFDGPLSGYDTNDASVIFTVEEGDFFDEGHPGSAPAWCYIIDGITVISD